MSTPVAVVAHALVAATLGTMLLGAAIGSANAADYDQASDLTPPRSGVVDELFLRAGGCPRNPNCIAPRVLPTEGYASRREALVGITVPAILRSIASPSFYGPD